MSLRIFILEDEQPAVALLERALRRWDANVVIAGTADSIRAAVDWLDTHPEPDIILADIMLSDGISLSVFEQRRVSCPVVFTTAYDDYIRAAMEHNAIDYLLKPIEERRLAQALDKYLRFRTHFVGRLAALAADLAHHINEPTRVVARRGSGYVAVSLDRVAWFTTEDKQTILVERNGKRHLVNETLSELEGRLGERFFRLNRQYLASADAIAGFESAGRGRVLVSLEPRTDDDVLVSQEAAEAFRTWISH